MARAPSGYDLVTQGGECLQDVYLHQLRGEPNPDADRALADELWRASDNMRTVLLSGLEDLGDLVACASFADGGNELDTDSVGKVGWLVAEIPRLIEGALMVEDCAGALRTPDNPEPPSPPAAG